MRCRSPSPSAADAVDVGDAGADAVGVVEGLAGQLDVAVDAEVAHHRPRAGHRQTRPGALEVGRGVEATEPVVEHEGLVAPQFLAAMQDDRHALGGVAELVDVGRDRGDARDPEVPRGDGAPEPLGERQDEAAHAGVDVTARADRLGQGGDVGDGVHDALGVLRSRADDQHGVVVDVGGHGVDVGGPVGDAPASCGA